MTRPGWDDYFLAIAQAVATRGDCTRRQVGAVLVSPDHRIISTGYNGAPSGHRGCLAGGCPRGKLTYDDLAHQAGSYDDCVALHAELNCLIYAGREASKGATLYITDEPCDGCKKVIYAACIDRVRTPTLRWNIAPVIMFDSYDTPGIG